MRRNDITAHRRHRTHSRGQALAEFALILPILLGLVGAGVDFARAFQGAMTLQTASRNAAEAAAYEATTLTDARTVAREVVCAETRRLPGFVPGSGGDTATCTNPSVSVTYGSSATAPGANARYPLVTVTVNTSIDFALLVPWPFMPDGSWTLSATEEFELLQGR